MGAGQKSADDKRATELQVLEDEENLKKEEQRAQLLQSMEPLCRGCVSRTEMDFGVLGLHVEQMCERHQE